MKSFYKKLKRGKNSVEVTNYELFSMLNKPGVTKIEIPTERVMDFVKYANRNLKDKELHTEENGQTCFISFKKKD